MTSLKIEVIKDSKYLFPDNYETIRATEILAMICRDAMYPDLNVARARRCRRFSTIMPISCTNWFKQGL